MLVLTFFLAYAKLEVMSWFKKQKVISTNSVVNPAVPAGAIANYSALAELTLNNITDGVMLIDESGMIKFANPAAATMMGYGSPSNVIGLSYQAVLRLERIDGSQVSPEKNKLTHAVETNQPLISREYLLISAQSERRAAIALTLTPTGGPHTNRIITFRDITKELEEEEKQSEFISTASHEMRTPVASIEGYLGLALNPQTATIDDRARQYLEAAHASSQHLGRLFKDLLDVTKLDDGRLKVHLVPVEIVSVVREMAGSREKDMAAKHLKYSFGTSGPVTGDKQLNQIVYAAVDLDFMREILDNLIENAIKYTPDGGEIWVNARGDGDKVLINVTDTGIGISPEDAGHIFQKFYRVDNSQTRAIGGTGLGLYLVKQRVEAMGGRVWVESAFGDGSTFFVSLPRLTPADYQRRLVAYQNEQAAQALTHATSPKPAVPTMASLAAPSAAAPLATSAETTAKVIKKQEAPVQPVAGPLADALEAAKTARAAEEATREGQVKVPAAIPIAQPMMTTPPTPETPVPAPQPPIANQINQKESV